MRRRGRCWIGCWPDYSSWIPRRGMGVGSMCEVFTRTLPGQLASVAQARSWLTGLLTTRLSDTDVVDTARLVVSELMSNAVRHGGAAAQPTSPADAPAPPAGGAAETIGLRLFVAARRIRIDVTDPGCGVDISAAESSVPIVQRPDAEAEHGRGLALVEALAERLSWQLDVRGCTVSVQLTHTPARRPDARAVRQEALLHRVF